MLLQLKNIFKWVQQGGQRVFLLKDINLEVEEGEFISIMGPSGSGVYRLCISIISFVR